MCRIKRYSKFIVTFFVLIIFIVLQSSCISRRGHKADDNNSYTSRDLYSYRTYVNNYEIVYDDDGCIAVSVVDSLGRSQTTFAKLDNVPGEYQRIKDKIISVYWQNQIESIISYHSGVILNSERVVCYDDYLKFHLCEQSNLSAEANIDVTHSNIMLQVMAQTEKIVNNSYTSIEGWENLKKTISRTYDLHNKDIIEIDSIDNPNVYRKVQFFIEASKKINTFYNKQIIHNII